MQQEPRVYHVSLWLSVLCILVFALQNGLDITSILDVGKESVRLQPWRALTAIFAHADVGHLLSNLFALALFGLILEGRIGSKRVFLLFLVTGIVVNFFSPYEHALGASGAIFGILGCLIVLRPWMIIWLSGIPMPMILAGMGWLISDIMGIFTPDNIANEAHIGGLIIGVCYGLYLRKDFADRPEKKRKEESEIEHEVYSHIRDWEDKYLR